MCMVDFMNSTHNYDFMNSIHNYDFTIFENIIFPLLLK